MNTQVYVPTPEEREADKKGELIAAVTAVVVIMFPFGLAATLAHNAGTL
jgi:phenylpyruvate tautomerase PptA (4-oxalocrotonate tautomerase family)